MGHRKEVVMIPRTGEKYKMEQLKNIFASSCIEATARKSGCSTGEMYRRMKRVGLISGFILPGYEALHTQSREHVTEDVLGALHIWEQKQGIGA